MTKHCLRPPDVLLWCLCIVVLSHAGSKTLESFLNTGTSLRLSGEDTLVLDNQSESLVKLSTQDFELSATAGTNARVPDVYTTAPGSFVCVWAQTDQFSPSIEHVVAQQIQTTVASLQHAGEVILYPDHEQHVTYCHAVHNGTREMVTFVTGGFDTLRAVSGSATHDSLGIKSPRSSLCAFRNDTFLVAQSVNDKKLVLNKTGAEGSDLRVYYHDTLASVSGAKDLVNPSLVATGSGKILVTYQVRVTTGDGTWKRARFLLLQPDFTQLDEGILRERVSEMGSSVYAYDQIFSVEYENDRVATVVWHEDTVFVHDIDLSSNTVSDNPFECVRADTARFPTIGASRDEVFVFWIGNVVQSQRAGIECARIPVQNSSLVQNVQDTLRLSDADAAPELSDFYDAHINAAVNDTGEIACVWTDDSRAWGTIWALRKSKYLSGTWISGVDSVVVQNSDSVHFFRTVLDSGDNGYGVVADSLRVGRVADTAQQDQWSPWISPANADSLDKYARSKARFYQRQIVFDRNTATPLFSPFVASHSLHWNVQPVVRSLDSVRIGDSVYTDITFGDTLGTGDGAQRCLVRLDSIEVFATVDDPDAHSVQIRTTLAQQHDTTVSSASRHRLSVDEAPLEVNDTVYSCSIRAVDSAAWAGPTKSFFISVSNDVPALSVRAVIDTHSTQPPDTIPVGDPTRLTVQQEDSVVFLYSLHDENDTGSYCYVTADLDTVDSVRVGDTARYVFNGSRVTDTSYSEVGFYASDADTTAGLRAVFGVNHRPIFTHAIVEGDTLYRGDSVAVSISARCSMAVAAADSDLAHWDTIRYVFETAQRDTTSDSSWYAFIPTRADSIVRVIVEDIYGRRDSALFYLQYPWFAQAESTNYSYTVDSLSDSLRTIINGVMNADSVFLPVHNTGNGLLRIDSVRFAGSPDRWLEVSLPCANGSCRYSSLTSDMAWTPITLAPDSHITIGFHFSDSALTGDGYVYDTVMVYTNDAQHTPDTIAVRMEYNDLPRLEAFNPSFEAKEPYWLAKRTAGSSDEYSFPPHGEIVLGFSEGMATGFADSALRLFSIRDSAYTGTVEYIPYTQQWNASRDTLRIAPAYRYESPYFGIRPVAGQFIPTDSIAIVVTSYMTDDAATISGPNALDVDRDYRRDMAADTMFRLRIDSIPFSLVSVTPGAATDTASSDFAVTLLFSDTLYPGTVDTSRSGNRSLSIGSSYRDDTTQIAYDSIIVRGKKAIFYPSMRFYYDDRITCTYRAVTGRDELGYSIDANRDGIAHTVYDSGDTSDNVTWQFSVRPIRVISVSPDSAATDAAENAPVTITFDQPLFPHTIDTDSLQHNRSLIVTTKYSRGHQVPFRSIEIDQERTSVSFMPDTAFFGNDSVHCLFRGLSRAYSYDDTLFAVPGSTGLAQKEWFFYTATVSFYTYPNPYKPGENPRHRTFGGICFKNFHSLTSSAVTRMRVVIYSIKGFAVYDSRKDGEEIVIREGATSEKPQWIWDTKNAHGDPVASGLYLYAVLDRDDAVLKKGKIVLVR